MSARRPPTAVITWDASALGADFAGYDVGVRPSRVPVEEFQTVFAIRVPPDRDPATIEANHTRVHDVMAGWSSRDGGRWGGGHDWAVRARDARRDKPGPWEIIDTQVEVPSPTFGSWVTTNHAWWLSCALEVIPDGIDTTVDVRTFEYDTAGPADEVSVATRTRGEAPSRRAGGTGFFFELSGDDQLRHLYACAHAGLPVALLRPTGDRYLGTLRLSRHGDMRVRRVSGDLSIVETARQVSPAEFNLPCAQVLNGSDEYGTVADDPGLRPGTEPCTIYWAGRLDATASKVALAKGDLAGSAAFGVRTTGTANQMQVVYGAETLAAVDAGFFAHDVVVCVRYDGTGLLRMDVDAVTVASDAAATPGNLNSSAALRVGADHTPANHMAAHVAALAVYPGVEHTDVEVLAATGYLSGWPGHRMPPGAAVFHDRRDTRAGAVGDSTMVDLSGNARTLTWTGAPPVRGYPAPLARLERY